MLMLTASLLLNALIVFPVSIGMLSGQPGMDAAFGTQSDARSILASVYLAIGLVSVAALGGLALGYGDVVIPMAAGLLVMQVVYKTITIATVGTASPVVMTNVLVIVVHLITLAILARSWSA